MTTDRLWLGAVLSNTGTWMQTIALGWYVFQLTHSTFWVSFITFVNFIPIVLSPLGGVYTDRLDRKKILVGTQTIMMLDAAVRAVLAAPATTIAGGVGRALLGAGDAQAVSRAGHSETLPASAEPLA